MPTVRHILKNDLRKGDEIAPSHSLASHAPPGAAVGTGEGVGPQDSGGPSTAELIAERLRQGADQRVALAQGEINRLKVHVDQLQSQLEELESQKLPLGGVKADLKEAHERLKEVKADLVRAHEVRQNTDLTASLSHEQHEGHEHQHHKALDATSRMNVRSALGKTGADADPARQLDKSTRQKL